MSAAATKSKEEKYVEVEMPKKDVHVIVPEKKMHDEKSVHSGQGPQTGSAGTGGCGYFRIHTPPRSPTKGTSAMLVATASASVSADLPALPEEVGAASGADPPGGHRT